MIALYPYKAQNDDELSFDKDDIISVVGRDEPEWWRGELNGLTGLFPSNYVGKFVTSGKWESIDCQMDLIINKEPPRLITGNI